MVEKLEELQLARIAFHLRALILALGESVRPPWWKTEFMTETGLRFLERLYPRSFFAAAINSAGRAACEAHDRAVGRVGAYHLFRLPEVLEAEIHIIPPSTNEEFFARLRPCLAQVDKLAEMLRLYCNGETVDGNGPGPRRMGEAADLTTPRAFRRVAAAYSLAFSRGNTTFPYFTAEQGGAKG